MNADPTTRPRTHGIAKLDTPIQHYDWGSHEFIAAMQGRPAPTQRPEAELWIGDHPRAPASLLTDRGVVPLPDFIARHPIEALGSATHAQFGAQLPFLAKILAAARPLSLQVHPDREQALHGFTDEEARQVPLSDPHRTYPDSNRKIELMIAMEPFSALSGFRDAGSLDWLLDDPRMPALRTLRAAVDPARHEAASLFFALRGLDPGARARVLDELHSLARRRRADLPEAAWVGSLLDFYPGDVGAAAPLLMNLVELNPGQGLFVRPGTLHSYLRGNGFEVMSSSDNVIRGGLTPKHVDQEALAQVACTAPMAPEIIDPQRVEPGVVEYALGRFGVEEFSVRHLSLGDRFEVPSISSASVGRAAILLCVEGTARLCTIAGKRDTAYEIDLSAGEAAWIPADVDAVEVFPLGRRGSARLFEVRVP